MASHSIAYEERSGFHVEGGYSLSTKTAPRARRTVSEWATEEQALEEARWAMKVHRMAVIVPTSWGFTQVLIDCLAARGLILPMDMDPVELYDRVR